MEFLVITFPLDIIFIVLSENIPILEKRQRSCIGGLGFLPGYPSHQKQHRLSRRECPSHLEGSFVKPIQSLNPIGCVNHPMKLRRIVQIGVRNQNPAANLAQLALSLLIENCNQNINEEG